ncbi:MAG: hypothetical protein OXF61_15365 [Acidimicrobiaceae bacterium]|nr:hypothetical protein [Acidimicrobiaceae bacterium]
MSRCWRRQPDAEAAPTLELDESFDAFEELLSEEADSLLAESLVVLEFDEPDESLPGAFDVLRPSDLLSFR